MPHRNAPLTETGRARLARCVVDQGYPLRAAAERFQVAVPTAKRWADRYRAHGGAGLADRPSRPRSSPARTGRRRERRVVKLRVTRQWGPARIGARLGMAPSTVGRVLARYRVPRLASLDRATGAPVRRYERDHPGALVHVDVKKLGRIPDGGGHRALGRAAGRANKPRSGAGGAGYGFIHSALDDHSRLAYSEIHPDERKHTAAEFWTRAAAYFTSVGIHPDRVLTDNAWAYRSTAFRAALAATGTAHKRTRAYRPQTNGKVERFHRTLLDEWAYARPYRCEAERRAAFDTWIHGYNHHRGHTALGGHPPASRVTNLTGEYI